MKTFRFLALVLALFPVIAINAQCAVVPGANTTFSADTLYCVNASSGTVSGTTYTWTLYMDPLNISGVPSGSVINTSTSYNPPPVQYTANGLYLVELIARNSPTCPSQTFTTHVVVCTYTPNFTYTLTSGAATFSTNAAGAGLNATNWMFGDGSSGNGNPITHTYFNGSYSPTLLAIYANYTCVIAVTSSVITITNNPCNADAAFTYTTGSGGVVSFSNTAAGDTSVARLWNFGDGSTSTLKNPVHTYAIAGNYNVTLGTFHLFNPSSCNDSSIINVNITGIPCIANSNFSLFPIGPPNSHVYNIVPQYPYNFSAVTWDWGDGSTSNTLYTSHTYSAAGSYDICLTVTTSCGSMSASCMSQYLAKGTPADLVYINTTPPELVTGVEEAPYRTRVVTVFPNPSSDGLLYIHSEPAAGILEMRVHNLLGKEVYHDASPSSEESFPVNLSILSSGIYFLQFVFPEKIDTYKFIISR